MREARARDTTSQGMVGRSKELVKNVMVKATWRTWNVEGDIVRVDPFLQWF